jgi:quinolinate synthase
MYLGDWVRKQTGRKIHLWPGSCHVHHLIKTDEIVEMKREHPRAKVVIHPECGCTSSSLKLADKVLSTEGMVRYANEDAAQEYIVGTETGILHKMQKQNPQKQFYPVNQKAVCEFMKMITIEKVLWSLEDLKYEVKVPEAVAAKARRAIERMVAIV